MMTAERAFTFMFRKSGSKSWSQKIRFGGKQLELGLGNYPMVSLAEARRVAAENKARAAWDQSQTGKGEA